MTEDPVWHRDDCPGAELHSLIGAHGDRLVRCRGCAMFRVVDEHPAELAHSSNRRPFPTVPPAPAVSIYTRRGNTWPRHRYRARARRARAHMKGARHD